MTQALPAPQAAAPAMQSKVEASTGSSKGIVTVANPQRDFPTAISADMMSGAGRLVHVTTGVLCAFATLFVVWASFAVIEEVTIGQGKVIPASKIQIVQNLEGGIVKHIAIREGDIVERGALLVQIDPTGLGSDLDEKREKIMGLTALYARLKSEADGAELIFPPEIVARRPDLVRQQLQHHESRRREIGGTLDVLDRQADQKRQEIAETRAKIRSVAASLALANEELQLTEPLVKQGAAARVDVLRLQTRIAELTGQFESFTLAIPRLEQAIAEARSQRQQKEMSFRSETLKDLNEVDVQRAGLTQSARGQADKVARTDVRAPGRGVIKTLNVTTVGQVLRPGQEIVEIVPLDDTLLVEARLAPKDVAFLRPGQDAVVKISAYDYTLYGSLAGRLERIGADAVTPEKGESFYVIGVRTDKAHLEKDGRILPIIPGMIAEVDILSGKKTIMQYLIKPITRMRHEALRER